jgi:hypothetical protein
MELEKLLTQGRDLVDRTTRAHAERWGLGTARQWVLDQDTGIIRWSFEDHVVSAPAQVLGSWNSKVSTFVWAWDNETIQASLSVLAGRIRAFGLEHEVPALSTSPLNVDEEQVRDLVAVAFGLTGEVAGDLGGGTGIYHPYDGQLATYISFGTVTIEEPGGRVSTFDGSAA